MTDYYLAEYGKERFNCPDCGVYARPKWSNLVYKPIIGFANISDTLMDIAIC